MADFVTLTEAGRRLGCSQQNLSLLKKNEKISPPTHGKLYDYETLKKEYEDNTDPERRLIWQERLKNKGKKVAPQKKAKRPPVKKRAKKPEKIKKTPPKPAPIKIASEDRTEDPPENFDTFNHHRKRKEEYAADLKQLELQKVRGELVEKVQVEHDLFNLGRELQEGMTMLYTRLSPYIAKENIEHVEGEINTLVSDIMHSVEVLSK